MSTATAPSTTTTNQSTPNIIPIVPKITLNLEYLAPTLTAIIAAIIHHICREKHEMTMGDFLLILSPSMPILCSTFLRIISSLLSFFCNISLTDLSYFNFGGSTTESPVTNDGDDDEYIYSGKHGLDKHNRIIFVNYTKKINIEEKMAQWQKEKLYTTRAPERATVLPKYSKFMSNFTKYIELEYPPFVNFYHEMDVNSDRVIMYITHNNATKMYTVYMAATSPYLLNIDSVQTILFPPAYRENLSFYRISRIYNEKSPEILKTIIKFKANDTNSRKICANFLLSGPPGTCKTACARAIAAELSRKVFEIELSKITYEDEFLQIFTKNRIDEYVFLLDEIDLMCPTREFDDKLNEMRDMERLKNLGVVTTDSVSSNVGDNSYSLSYNNNNDQQLKDMQNKIDDMQNALTNGLIGLETLLSNSIKSVIGLVLMTTTVHQSAKFDENITKRFNLKPKMSEYMDNVSADIKVTEQYLANNDPTAVGRAPFTLRTLLNFISGGNTDDKLCIVGTTNRPDKLDPALIRPGRMRLMEFKNLRIVDAVQMIHEIYPDVSLNEIESLLHSINYQDEDASGAVLEAVMTSTTSIESLITLFADEIKLQNLQNKKLKK